MRTVVPTLQGRGWSTDLNYLEPVQPKNHFRPFDNPLEAPAPRPFKGGRASVLVVDSPAPEPRGPVVYDLDGNGKVDEDHGHGPFVASLVKLLAPSAEVVLAGVRGRQIPSLARWSPMMFTDADLIRAMGTAFGLSPGGTAVRRGFNVVNLSLGGAGCDGIAARLPLGRFMRDLAGLAFKLTRVTPRYVAASGNDGGDVKHFPAAWRDKPTIERAADAVDLALGTGAPTPAGNQIRQIQAFLQGSTHRRRVVDGGRPRRVLQLRHVGQRHRRWRPGGRAVPEQDRTGRAGVGRASPRPGSAPSSPEARIPATSTSARASALC